MPDALDNALAHAEAERRIRAAMNRVEQAQRALELACQDLCDVSGAGPLWSAVGKLQDRVHSMWSRLARFIETGRFDLDGVARQAFDAKRAAARAATSSPKGP
jgi:hypothetical protein